jgi:hypothetical protein
MTKTIVLGEQPNPVNKKPIEFFSLISLIDNDNVEVDDAKTKPHYWKYIELICKGYAPNLDLLYAYNDASNRCDGILIIGRWNDGVVN